ncbi:hypothetical protein M758_1G094800 [Ceratodon purpureus]|uniref:DC-UbP/UBTD2 N-terminal domain-containing protein n=1 Tax=Ceratodon purpureus TaxID=3225 RepID=A0A8T0J5I9_CERPU|nr:hypothetical protein KC19_1G087700 [Ceratodon purpureus]KAG0629329.1 hypothetical protein M758_1G094800 [Ceratodon purpureus]
MGCVGSKAVKGVDRHQKKVKRPKPWKHTEDITRTQLKQMRDEFWDTAPHYGGKKEIWDALRAAAEAEINLAQLIVDSAGIIVQTEDLSTCYDERGAKYDLPKYVLSEPTNIKDD